MSERPEPPMVHRDYPDRGGFTLIELLILVAIVVIIVAIVRLLLPPACCPPPAVGSVDVIPQKVYAEPNTRFRLDARVMGPGRDVIDVSKYPEIEIEWSSPTPGVVVTSSLSAVTIDVPNAPGTTIQVVATVTWHFEGQTDTYASAPTEIVVNPALPIDGDWVVVPHTPGQRPVTVLIEAGEAGVSGCAVQDWTLAVVERAWLGLDLEDNAGCSPEFGVFAEGSEFLYETTGYWTAGIDTRTVTLEPVFSWTDPDDAAPDSWRRFDVVIGVPSSAGNAEAVATDHVKFAATMLEDTGAGLGLRPKGGGVTFAHGYTAPLDPAEGCDRPFIDDTMLDLLPFYTVAVETLFVFFVTDVKGATKGWACEPIPGKDGRVVYVALNEFERSTVVHELAHIFGLKLPLLGGGHSNSLGTFEEDNLMWGSRDRDLRKQRARFSTGQLFRINLADGGWPADRLGGPTITCQDSALIADPCPMLDLEPGS